MEVKLKHRIAWAVLASWVVVIILAQWLWLEQNLQPFLHEHAKKIEPSLTLSTSARIRFVHFHDPECTCSVLGQTHVNRIKNAYPDMQHIEVVAGAPRPDNLGFDTDFAISSPSIAILAESGKILYYGPYTDGAICGLGLDLVEASLNQYQNNSSFQWLNVLTSGCFCSWKPA